jgi:hypothetical protein
MKQTKQAYAFNILTYNSQRKLIFQIFFTISFIFGWYNFSIRNYLIKHKIYIRLHCCCIGKKKILKRNQKTSRLATDKWKPSYCTRKFKNTKLQITRIYTFNNYKMRRSSVLIAINNQFRIYFFHIWLIIDGSSPHIYTYIYLCNLLVCPCDKLFDLILCTCTTKAINI